MMRHSRDPSVQEMEEPPSYCHPQRPYAHQQQPSYSSEAARRNNSRSALQELELGDHYIQQQSLTPDQKRSLLASSPVAPPTPTYLVGCTAARREEHTNQFFTKKTKKRGGLLKAGASLVGKSSRKTKYNDLDGQRQAVSPGPDPIFETKVTSFNDTSSQNSLLEVPATKLAPPSNSKPKKRRFVNTLKKLAKRVTGTNTSSKNKPAAANTPPAIAAQKILERQPETPFDEPPILTPPTAPLTTKQQADYTTMARHQQDESPPLPVETPSPPLMCLPGQQDPILDGSPAADGSMANDSMSTHQNEDSPIRKALFAEPPSYYNERFGYASEISDDEQLEEETSHHEEDFTLSIVGLAQEFRSVAQTTEGSPAADANTVDFNSHTVQRQLAPEFHQHASSIANNRSQAGNPRTTMEHKPIQWAPPERPQDFQSHGNLNETHTSSEHSGDRAKPGLEATTAPVPPSEDQGTNPDAAMQKENSEPTSLQILNPLSSTHEAPEPALTWWPPELGNKFDGEFRLISGGAEDNHPQDQQQASSNAGSYEMITPQKIENCPVQGSASPPKPAEASHCDLLDSDAKMDATLSCLLDSFEGSDEALEYALEQHERELERQELELRLEIEALRREEEGHCDSSTLPTNDSEDEAEASEPVEGEKPPQGFDSPTSTTTGSVLRKIATPRRVNGVSSSLWEAHNDKSVPGVLTMEDDVESLDSLEGSQNHDVSLQSSRQPQDTVSEITDSRVELSIKEGLSSSAEGTATVGSENIERESQVIAVGQSVVLNDTIKTIEASAESEEKDEGRHIIKARAQNAGSLPHYKEAQIFDDKFELPSNSEQIHAARITFSNIGHDDVALTSALHSEAREDTDLVRLSGRKEPSLGKQVDSFCDSTNHAAKGETSLHQSMASEKSHDTNTNVVTLGESCQETAVNEAFINDVSFAGVTVNSEAAVLSVIPDSYVTDAATAASGIHDGYVTDAATVASTVHDGYVTDAATVADSSCKDGYLTDVAVDAQDGYLTDIAVDSSAQEVRKQNFGSAAGCRTETTSTPATSCGRRRCLRRQIRNEQQRKMDSMVHERRHSYDFSNGNTHLLFYPNEEAFFSGVVRSYSGDSSEYTPDRQPHYVLPSLIGPSKAGYCSDTSASNHKDSHRASRKPSSLRKRSFPTVDAEKANRANGQNVSWKSPTATSNLNAMNTKCETGVENQQKQHGKNENVVSWVADNYNFLKKETQAEENAMSLFGQNQQTANAQTAIHHKKQNLNVGEATNSNPQHKETEHNGAIDSTPGRKHHCNPVQAKVECLDTHGPFTFEKEAKAKNHPQQPNNNYKGVSKMKQIFERGSVQMVTSIESKKWMASPETVSTGKSSQEAPCWERGIAKSGLSQQINPNELENAATISTAYKTSQPAHMRLHLNPTHSASVEPSDNEIPVTESIEKAAMPSPSTARPQRSFFSLDGDIFSFTPQEPPIYSPLKPTSPQDQVQGQSHLVPCLLGSNAFLEKECTESEPSSDPERNNSILEEHNYRSKQEPISSPQASPELSYPIRQELHKTKTFASQRPCLAPVEKGDRFQPGKAEKEESSYAAEHRIEESEQDVPKSAVDESGNIAGNLTTESTEFESEESGSVSKHKDSPLGKGETSPKVSDLKLKFDANVTSTKGQISKNSQLNEETVGHHNSPNESRAVPDDTACESLQSSSATSRVVLDSLLAAAVNDVTPRHSLGRAKIGLNNINMHLEIGRNDLGPSEYLGEQPKNDLPCEDPAPKQGTLKARVKAEKAEPLAIPNARDDGSCRRPSVTDGMSCSQRTVFYDTVSSLGADATALSNRTEGSASQEYFALGEVDFDQGYHTPLEHEDKDAIKSIGVVSPCGKTAVLETPKENNQGLAMPETTEVMTKVKVLEDVFGLFECEGHSNLIKHEDKDSNRICRVVSPGPSAESILEARKEGNQCRVSEWGEMVEVLTQDKTLDDSSVPFDCKGHTSLMEHQDKSYPQSCRAVSPSAENILDVSSSDKECAELQETIEVSSHERLLDGVFGPFDCENHDALIELKEIDAHEKSIGMSRGAENDLEFSREDRESSERRGPSEAMKREHLLDDFFGSFDSESHDPKPLEGNALCPGQSTEPCSDLLSNYSDPSIASLSPVEMSVNNRMDILLNVTSKCDGQAAELEEVMGKLLAGKSVITGQEKVTSDWDHVMDEILDCMIKSDAPTKAVVPDWDDVMDSLFNDIIDSDGVELDPFIGDGHARDFSEGCGAAGTAYQHFGKSKRSEFLSSPLKTPRKLADSLQLLCEEIQVSAQEDISALGQATPSVASSEDLGSLSQLVDNVEEDPCNITSNNEGLHPSQGPHHTTDREATGAGSVQSSKTQMSSVASDRSENQRAASDVELERLDDVVFAGWPAGTAEERDVFERSQQKVTKGITQSEHKNAVTGLPSEVEMEPVASSECPRILDCGFSSGLPSDVEMEPIVVLEGPSILDSGGSSGLPSNVDIDSIAGSECPRILDSGCSDTNRSELEGELTNSEGLSVENNLPEKTDFAAYCVSKPDCISHHVVATEQDSHCPADGAKEGSYVYGGEWTGEEPQETGILVQRHSFPILEPDVDAQTNQEVEKHQIVEATSTPPAKIDGQLPIPYALSALDEGTDSDGDLKSAPPGPPLSPNAMEALIEQPEYLASEQVPSFSHDAVTSTSSRFAMDDGHIVSIVMAKADVGPHPEDPIKCAPTEQPELTRNEARLEAQLKVLIEPVNQFAASCTENSVAKAASPERGFYGTKTVNHEGHSRDHKDDERSAFNFESKGPRKVMNTKLDIQPSSMDTRQLLGSINDLLKDLTGAAEPLVAAKPQGCDRHEGATSETSPCILPMGLQVEEITLQGIDPTEETTSGSKALSASAEVDELRGSDSASETSILAEFQSDLLKTSASTSDVGGAAGICIQPSCHNQLNSSRDDSVVVEKQVEDINVAASKEISCIKEEGWKEDTDQNQVLVSLDAMHNFRDEKSLAGHENSEEENTNTEICPDQPIRFQHSFNASNNSDHSSEGHGFGRENGSHASFDDSSMVDCHPNGKLDSQFSGQDKAAIDEDKGLQPSWSCQLDAKSYASEVPQSEESLNDCGGYSCLPDSVSATEAPTDAKCIKQANINCETDGRDKSDDQASESLIAENHVGFQSAKNGKGEEKGTPVPIQKSCSTSTNAEEQLSAGDKPRSRSSCQEEYQSDVGDTDTDLPPQAFTMRSLANGSVVDMEAEGQCEVAITVSEPHEVVGLVAENEEQHESVGILSKKCGEQCEADTEKDECILENDKLSYQSPAMRSIPDTNDSETKLKNKNGRNHEKAEHSVLELPPIDDHHRVELEDEEEDQMNHGLSLHQGCAVLDLSSGEYLREQRQDSEQNQLCDGTKRLSFYESCRMLDFAGCNAEEGCEVAVDLESDHAARRNSLYQSCSELHLPDKFEHGTGLKEDAVGEEVNGQGTGRLSLYQSCSVLDLPEELLDAEPDEDNLLCDTQETLHHPSSVKLIAPEGREDKNEVEAKHLQRVSLYQSCSMLNLPKEMDGESQFEDNLHSQGMLLSGGEHKFEEEQAGSQLLPKLSTGMELAAEIDGKDELIEELVNFETHQSSAVLNLSAEVRCNAGNLKEQLQSATKRVVLSEPCTRLNHSSEEDRGENFDNEELQSQLLPNLSGETTDCDVTEDHLHPMTQRMSLYQSCSELHFDGEMDGEDQPKEEYHFSEINQSSKKPNLRAEVGIKNEEEYLLSETQSMLLHQSCARLEPTDKMDDVDTFEDAQLHPETHQSSTVLKLASEAQSECGVEEDQVQSDVLPQQSCTNPKYCDGRDDGNDEDVLQEEQVDSETDTSSVPQHLSVDIGCAADFKEEQLHPAAQQRMSLYQSCSLLHLPDDMDGMDGEDEFEEMSTGSAHLGHKDEIFLKSCETLEDEQMEGLVHGQFERNNASHHPSSNQSCAASCTVDAINREGDIEEPHKEILDNPHHDGRHRASLYQSCSALQVPDGPDDELYRSCLVLDLPDEEEGKQKDFESCRLSHYQSCSALLTDEEFKCVVEEGENLKSIECSEKVADRACSSQNEQVLPNVGEGHGHMSEKCCTPEGVQTLDSAQLDECRVTEILTEITGDESEVKNKKSDNGEEPQHSENECLHSSSSFTMPMQPEKNHHGDMSDEKKPDPVVDNLSDTQPCGLPDGFAGVLETRNEIDGALEATRDGDTTPSSLYQTCEMLNTQEATRLEEELGGENVKATERPKSGQETDDKAVNLSSTLLTVPVHSPLVDEKTKLSEDHGGEQELDHWAHCVSLYQECAMLNLQEDTTLQNEKDGHAAHHLPHLESKIMEIPDDRPCKGKSEVVCEISGAPESDIVADGHSESSYKSCSATDIPECEVAYGEQCKGHGTARLSLIQSCEFLNVSEIGYKDESETQHLVLSELCGEPSKLEMEGTFHASAGPVEPPSSVYDATVVNSGAVDCSGASNLDSDNKVSNWQGENKHFCNEEGGCGSSSSDHAHDQNSTQWEERSNSCDQSQQLSTQLSNVDSNEEATNWQVENSTVTSNEEGNHVGGITGDLHSHEPSHGQACKRSHDTPQHLPTKTLNLDNEKNNSGAFNGGFSCESGLTCDANVQDSDQGEAGKHIDSTSQLLPTQILLGDQCSQETSKLELGNGSEDGLGIAPMEELQPNFMCGTDEAALIPVPSEQPTRTEEGSSNEPTKDEGKVACIRSYGGFPSPSKRRLFNADDCHVFHNNAERQLASPKQNASSAGTKEESPQLIALDTSNFGIKSQKPLASDTDEKSSRVSGSSHDSKSISQGSRFEQELVRLKERLSSRRCKVVSFAGQWEAMEVEALSGSNVSSSETVQSGGSDRVKSLLKQALESKRRNFSPTVRSKHSAPETKETEVSVRESAAVSEGDSDEKSRSTGLPAQKPGPMASRMINQWENKTKTNPNIEIKRTRKSLAVGRATTLLKENFGKANHQTHELIKEGPGCTSEESEAQCKTLLHDSSCEEQTSIDGLANLHSLKDSTGMGSQNTFSLYSDSPKETLIVHPSSMPTKAENDVSPHAEASTDDNAAISTEAQTVHYEETDPSHSLPAECENGSSWESNNTLMSVTSLNEVQASNQWKADFDGRLSEKTHNDAPQKESNRTTADESVAISTGAQAVHQWQSDLHSSLAGNTANDPPIEKSTTVTSLRKAQTDNAWEADFDACLSEKTPKDPPQEVSYGATTDASLAISTQAQSVHHLQTDLNGSLPRNITNDSPKEESNERTAATSLNEAHTACKGQTNFNLKSKTRKDSPLEASNTATASPETNDMQCSEIPSSKSCTTDSSNLIGSKDEAMNSLAEETKGQLCLQVEELPSDAAEKSTVVPVDPPAGELCYTGRANSPNPRRQRDDNNLTSVRQRLASKPDEIWAQIIRKANLLGQIGGISFPQNSFRSVKSKVHKYEKFLRDPNFSGSVNSSSIFASPATIAGLSLSKGNLGGSSATKNSLTHGSPTNQARSHHDAHEDPSANLDFEPSQQDQDGSESIFRFRGKSLRDKEMLSPKRFSCQHEAAELPDEIRSAAEMIQELEGDDFDGTFSLCSTIRTEDSYINSASVVARMLNGNNRDDRQECSGAHGCPPRDNRPLPKVPNTAENLGRGCAETKRLFHSTARQGSLDSINEGSPDAACQKQKSSGFVIHNEDEGSVVVSSVEQESAEDAPQILETPLVASDEEAPLSPSGPFKETEAQKEFPVVETVCTDESDTGGKDAAELTSELHNDISAITLLVANQEETASVAEPTNPTTTTESATNKELNETKIDPDGKRIFSTNETIDFLNNSILENEDSLDDDDTRDNRPGSRGLTNTPLMTPLLGSPVMSPIISPIMSPLLRSPARRGETSVPIEATFNVFRELVTETFTSWNLPTIFNEDSCPIADLKPVDTTNPEIFSVEVALDPFMVQGEAAPVDPEDSADDGVSEHCDRNLQELSAIQEDELETDDSFPTPVEGSLMEESLPTEKPMMVALPSWDETEIEHVKSHADDRSKSIAAAEPKESKSPEHPEDPFPNTTEIPVPPTMGEAPAANEPIDTQEDHPPMRPDPPPLTNINRVVKQSRPLAPPRAMAVLPPVATIQVKPKKAKKKEKAVKDVSDFPSYFPQRSDSFDVSENYGFAMNHGGIPMSASADEQDYPELLGFNAQKRGRIPSLSFGGGSKKRSKSSGGL